MKGNVPSSECSDCGSQVRRLLHNVRHRGIYHRLCTSCILKLHAGLFCPICFEVYEGSSPSVNGVMCLRCPSVSHLSCVSKDFASCYVCPSCLSPSFVFFDAGVSNNKSRDGDPESVKFENQGVIDVKMAKVFVTAARIASISMSKAVTIARMEAERRVKEAALARKRAREALERVSSIASKEKKEKENEMMVVGRVLNSVVMVEPKEKAKGNSAIAADASVVAQKQFQNQFWAEAIDKSDGVIASLSNVDSREKERLVGLQSPTVAQGVPPKNGVSAVSTEKLKGCPTRVMSHQHPFAMNERGKASNLPLIEKNAVNKEEKNGLFSVTQAVRPPQHPRNSHDIEDDQRKSNGFGDSGMGPQITHSNQDVLVSQTNEGVQFMGSSNIIS